MTQRHFYTQKLLHKETQTHTKRFFYTEKLVSGVFAHRSFCTQKLFTDRTFYTEAFTQRSFYTEKKLHTANFCTEEFLRKETFTHRSSYTEPFLHKIASTIASPKSDLDVKAEKNTILKVFYWTFNRKVTSAKMQKKYWQITIATLIQPFQYDLRCSAAKETIVLCTQAWHQGTLTQPVRCDLQTLHCKTQYNNAQQRKKLQLQNRISTPKPKKTRFNNSITLLVGKSQAPKCRKITDKSPPRPSCSPSNTIYDVRLHSATKNNSSTHAATPLRHLCAAITMRLPTSRRQSAPLSARMATQCGNSHAAIPLRSASTDWKRAKTYAHMNSHSLPLQNTKEEPISHRFDRSRTRRTHEVPFIAGCSHWTRKNTRLRAPAFSQNDAHENPCSN